jgi:outer membrane protein
MYQIKMAWWAHVARTFLFSLFLFLGMGRYAFAQDCGSIASGSITLKAAIERALCLEPKIAISSAQIALSEAVLQEQRAARRASLDAVVPGTTSASRADSTTTHSTSASALLNLQYLLYDGGARRQRELQRSNELLASQQDLAVQSQEVILDFVGVWSDVLDALATEQSARAALTAARSSLASVQARLQAGTGTQVDVISAQSSAAQSERDLIVAQSTARQQLRTFAQRLALPGDAVGYSLEPVSSALVPFEPALPVQENFVHPQLKAQQERVTAAQASYEAAQADGGMTISVNGQVGPTWSRGNTTGVTDTTNSLGAEAGISLTVPLSDGGASKARAAQANAQLASERAQLADLRRQLDESLIQSESSLQTAQADIAASQAALDAAKQSENAQRARFDAGLGTLTELLTAQNDTATRARQLNTAQSQLLRATVQLAYARGRLHLLFTAPNARAPLGSTP